MYISFLLEITVTSDMTNSILFVSRIKRMLSALLAGTALMLPIIGAIIALIGKSQENQLNVDTVTTILHSWVFIVSVFIACILLCLKWYFTYVKLTYDPSWVMIFQKRFDEMRKDRSETAQALRENRGKLGDVKKNRDEFAIIEAVLDFFEDVAFYVRGDQLSPEVAWHHFYHWLRGYWNASREYVEAYRKEEPKAYANIQLLFETLCQIEVGRDKDKKREEEFMSMEDLDEFLLDEIREYEPPLKSKRK